MRPFRIVDLNSETRRHIHTCMELSKLIRHLSGHRVSEILEPEKL